MCDVSQFLKFGSPLEGYGERYVKSSDKKEEHGFGAGDKYVGEWSEDTKKPHGRGILILSNANIYIQYWAGGVAAPGNYINIFSNGEFKVGEHY